MLKGFKEFIMRGNVMDLAVAVVIGAAFTVVIGALVTGIINPLIGAVFNAKDLNSVLILSIPTVSGGHAQLLFGAFLAALIQFIIVAAVVYFAVVLPVNHLLLMAANRRKSGVVEDEDTPPTELDMLTEIRDLLAADREAAAGKHTP
ncbi:large conductance mechanosensitive channel protein MscL [Rathayibacter soli]|uniref:large conductance mechanosensitive channel protein MscL n=1 Tax=Rathayibacter soli TaxID=3144168 RepID=UPI0027E3EC29|nr:large conductance mechanosensitive channel protein MscL [Glaciibacter superstes]